MFKILLIFALSVLTCQFTRAEDLQERQAVLRSAEETVLETREVGNNDEDVQSRNRRILLPAQRPNWPFPTWRPTWKPTWRPTWRPTLIKTVKVRDSGDIEKRQARKPRPPHRPRPTPSRPRPTPRRPGPGRRPGRESGDSKET